MEQVSKNWDQQTMSDGGSEWILQYSWKENLDDDALTLFFTVLSVLQNYWSQVWASREKMPMMPMEM
jgi:hypothetical protein